MAKMMGKNQDNEIHHNDLENARKSEAALSRIRENIGTYIVELKKMLGTQEEMMTSPLEILDIFENSLLETIDEPITLPNFIKTLQQVQVDFDEDLDDEQDLACYRLAEILTILNERRGEKALATVFDLLGIKEEGRITTYLLDPGVSFPTHFSRCYGAILMSGTLFPPSMYGEILRVPNNREVIYEEYSSPFENDRRPVLIATDVTTKYSNRSVENTRLIREHIHSILRQTRTCCSILTIV